jgi:diguanylate cyclase (GGDEF)-like protein
MHDAQHLLVVDDDPRSRDALAALLREEGYRVTTADDGVSALNEIAKDLPDLVISDVQMPRGDGFHLVRRLRGTHKTSHLPIILVSGSGAADRRAAGIDLGADDFVAKPVDFAELLARVRSALRHASDRAQLERRALVDPLTGVLNRRGISDVVARAIARTRRIGGSLCVLMVDVDRFKAINDEHGHAAGDTVLRHVARSLTDAVRFADRVGRCGGDEFLVVLPGTDRDAALALAHRLRNLRLLPLAIGPDQAIEVAVSVGVASLGPDDTSDSLLERADREMYRVKRTTAELRSLDSGER